MIVVVIPQKSFAASVTNRLGLPTNRHVVFVSDAMTNEGFHGLGKDVPIIITEGGWGDFGRAKLAVLNRLMNHFGFTDIFIEGGATFDHFAWQMIVERERACA